MTLTVEQWQAEWQSAYDYALRRLGNPDDAKDAAQDCMARLLRYASRYRIRSLFAVSRRIAERVTGRRLRARFESVVNVDSELVMRLADERGGDTSVGSIDEVFETLLPIERKVLVLLKGEGLTHAAAASKLGISIHMVGQHATRAYRKLRESP